VVVILSGTVYQKWLHKWYHFGRYQVLSGSLTVRESRDVKLIESNFSLVHQYQSPYEAEVALDIVEKDEELEAPSAADIVPELGLELSAADDYQRSNASNIDASSTTTRPRPVPVQRYLHYDSSDDEGLSFDVYDEHRLSFDVYDEHKRLSFDVYDEHGLSFDVYDEHVDIIDDGEATGE